MNRDLVMLATDREDLGLVPSSTMRTEAQSAADDLGQTVTARCPLTDRLLATFKPRKDAR